MLDPGSEMDTFFIDGFKLLSNTTEMKKLKSGFLIKEMLERFTNKSQSKLKPDRSLWIYSGHDITISHLLNSLGLFDVISYHFFKLLKDLCVIISFIFYRITFHHMHRAFYLSYINQRTTFTFNSSIKIQLQKCYLH